MEKHGEDLDRHLLDSIIKGFGPFTSTPPPLPNHYNPNYMKLANQQTKFHNPQKNDVPRKNVGDLYSIYAGESSSNHPANTSTGLVVESVSENSNTNPWNVIEQERAKETTPTMMAVVPITQSQPTHVPENRTATHGCHESSKCIVVSEVIPSDYVVAIVRGANARRSEQGFTFKLYRGCDFQALYYACSVALHCSVADIFLVCEKLEGSRVRRVFINEFDKVDDISISDGAVITIHPSDGERNVDPRYIELKCSMDRPDHKKITKKLKFLPTATLVDVKREWCQLIQRDPNSIYIMVFSSLHGEGGTITLESANVKNGSIVRTGSLSLRDHLHNQADESRKYLWA